MSSPSPRPAQVKRCPYANDDDDDFWKVYSMLFAVSTSSRSRLLLGVEDTGRVTIEHRLTNLPFYCFPRFFFVLSCCFQLCLLHPVGAQKPHSLIISKRWRKGGTKREGSALRCLITSKGFLCSRAFIFESRDWELFLPHTKLPRANSLKSLTITYKACSPIGHFNIFKTEHVMCLLFERIFASEISEGK